MLRTAAGDPWKSRGLPRIFSRNGRALRARRRAVRPEGSVGYSSEQGVGFQPDALACFLYCDVGSR